MSGQSVRFDDGAAYEDMMGNWSRRAGETFIDWLAPRAGMEWIDVGCGNGAFSHLLFDRCPPARLVGVDPSEGQLAYARSRLGGKPASFVAGDAMALPCPDRSFDAATMALVIFFVPDPPKGVAEMVRVVRPGGEVASYAWDMLGGGFPMEPINRELRALGVPPPGPPRPEASAMGALKSLWSNAGVEAIETKAITVERVFAGFDDFWDTNIKGPGLKQTAERMSPPMLDELRARLRASLPRDAAGRVACQARANAIKGRVAA